MWACSIVLKEKNLQVVWYVLCLLKKLSFWHRCCKRGFQGWQTYPVAWDQKFFLERSNKRMNSNISATWFAAACYKAEKWQTDEMQNEDKNRVLIVCHLPKYWCVVNNTEWFVGFCWVFFLLFFFLFPWTNKSCAAIPPPLFHNIGITIP